MGFVMLAEFGETADFFAVKMEAIHGADFAFVVGIHDEDVIEKFKIIRLNFAGAAENFVSSFLQEMAHPMVGRIPLMEADGARGVDEKLLVQAGFLYFLVENHFRCWRAANVTHADKQNAYEIRWHGVNVGKICKITSNFSVGRCYHDELLSFL